MPQRRVQGHKIPVPRPPPVSRAVVKRSRRKGRGVFAAAGGISAHRLACYYPAKVIADPGLNTGHILKQLTGLLMRVLHHVFFMMRYC